MDTTACCLNLTFQAAIAMLSARSAQQQICPCAPEHLPVQKSCLTGIVPVLLQVRFVAISFSA